MSAELRWESSLRGPRGVPEHVVAIKYDMIVIGSGGGWGSHRRDARLYNRSEGLGRNVVFFYWVWSVGVGGSIAICCFFFFFFFFSHECSCCCLWHSNETFNPPTLGAYPKSFSQLPPTSSLAPSLSPSASPGIRLCWLWLHHCCFSSPVWAAFHVMAWNLRRRSCGQVALGPPAREASHAGEASQPGRPKGLRPKQLWGPARAQGVATKQLCRQHLAAKNHPK